MHNTVCSVGEKPDFGHKFEPFYRIIFGGAVYDGVLRQRIRNNLSYSISVFHSRGLHNKYCTWITVRIKLHVNTCSYELSTTNQKGFNIYCMLYNYLE